MTFDNTVNKWPNISSTKNNTLMKFVQSEFTSFFWKL